MSDTIHPDWFTYPIVKLAIAGGGDAASVLERLSDLLAHVEDKCPNVNYPDLFNSHHLDGLDACNLASQYSQLGLDRAADADLFDDLFDGEPVDDATRMYHVRAVAYDLRSQGWTIHEIAQELGYKSNSAVWALFHKKARKPARLTENQRRVGTYRPDLSGSDVARELGCHRQYVNACRRAVRKADL